MMHLSHTRSCVPASHPHNRTLSHARLRRIGCRSIVTGSSSKSRRFPAICRTVPPDSSGTTSGSRESRAIRRSVCERRPGRPVSIAPYLGRSSIERRRIKKIKKNRKWAGFTENLVLCASLSNTCVRIPGVWIPKSYQRTNFTVSIKLDLWRKIGPLLHCSAAAAHQQCYANVAPYLN